MVKMSTLQGGRGQYRLRVRYRLAVLAYAMAEGPTAAARRYGVCVRTVHRWRVRWRRDGLIGLAPRYPRHRAASKRRAVLEPYSAGPGIHGVRRGADPPVVAPDASNCAVHGHDPAGVS